LGYFKIRKYSFIFSFLQHLISMRPTIKSGKKILSPGNILFIGLSIMLMIFFISTALADIFNGIPVFQWLSTGWNYIMGVPISDIAVGSERIITEAAKNTIPQEIMLFGQLTLSSIGVVLLALLDEVLGIGLLFTAFITRVINQFIRPLAALSWLLLFASLVPSVVTRL